MFKNEKDFRFWLDKAYRDGASNQEIANVLRERYCGMTEIPNYVEAFLNQTFNQIRPGTQELHGLKPVSKTPRPPKPKSMCEHRYRILDSNVDNVHTGSKIVYLMVNAVFYCEKCLDIKHIHKTKSLEDEES
jgi:hypothetical protein